MAISEWPSSYIQALNLRTYSISLWQLLVQCMRMMFSIPFTTNSSSNRNNSCLERRIVCQTMQHRWQYRKSTLHCTYCKVHVLYVQYVPIPLNSLFVPGGVNYTVLYCNLKQLKLSLTKNELYIADFKSYHMWFRLAPNDAATEVRSESQLAARPDNFKLVDDTAVLHAFGGGRLQPSNGRWYKLRDGQMFRSFSWWAIEVRPCVLRGAGRQCDEEGKSVDVEASHR